MPRPKKVWAKRDALARGYRSGSEVVLRKQFAQAQSKLPEVTVGYEVEKLEYTKPVTKHTYLVDFKIGTVSGKTIYIECKGRFLSEDRKKHLLVKVQHPDKDIRFIFDDPFAFLSPKRTATQEKKYKEALANAKAKGLKRPLVREALPSKDRYDKWCDKHDFKWCSAKDVKTWTSWLSE